MWSANPERPQIIEYFVRHLGADPFKKCEDNTHAVEMAGSLGLKELTAKMPEWRAAWEQEVQGGTAEQGGNAAEVEQGSKEL